jgi:hypothetical protein
MKPLKTFNNVILGQFVLTGIPIKVYVDGVYYTITSPDDLEDQIYGFGMDEDGHMHEFDYRRITHLLVNDNIITLDVYNDAMSQEFGGDDKSKADVKDKEPDKDKEGEEEVSEEGAMPGMMDLIGEKSPCWDGYQQVGMKKKSGKMVPNCVPIKEATKDEIEADIEAAEAEIEAAETKEDAAKDTIRKAKDKIKAAKSQTIDESSHYTYGIGDIVKNKNKTCPHYGSIGIVSKILDLPDMLGKLITYRVVNNGSTYKPGDMLTKSDDQLIGAQYND